MMRDVISADDWSENFQYAIRLVSKRGGPQAVLSSDPTNFTRRFLLENLTTHDIFSESLWFECDRVVSEWEQVSMDRVFLHGRLLHYAERTRFDGPVRPLVVFMHRDVFSIVGVGIRGEDVWDIKRDGRVYRQGEFSRVFACEYP
jgi:hypothetical protein